jgi:iron complex outermembrane receptor protein
MNVNIIGNNAIEQRHAPSLLPLVVEETAGMFAAARGVMGYGVSGGGAGTMSVRGIGGAPTTGVLVLIDGHPQFMGMMGHPLADAYQSLAVERVEVALGPASSLYGSNAMGGVINIITQKQQQDGSSVRINSMYGSYNTSSTDMTAAMRKGKLHALLAASMNQTDGHREFMNFKQYSGYGKLGFDYINNWRAWGDVDITHFNSDAPSRLLDGSRRPIANMDRGAKADVMRYVASFVVENNYDKTSGALKFYYNYGEHFVKDRDTTTNALSASPFKSNDYAWGINAYQSYNIFENTETPPK